MKYKLAQLPIIGPIILFFYRLNIGRHYLLPSWRLFMQWLLRSREITNFTYELDATNYRYLAAFVAQITQHSYAQIMAYMDELSQDTELKSHIQTTTQNSSESHMADLTAGYGRRVGWYAFVRATKPHIVVETGVDKGLGSCVLTAALRRNAAEGNAGYYYGTDINPKAGYLLTGPYAEFGEILYGDSLESLKRLDKTIDLFVNDSDHSDDYEAEEYVMIAQKLSEKALVLGDNAHCTEKLLQFALTTQRTFLYFQEKPHNRWYPGAGIGVAFSQPGDIQ